MFWGVKMKEREIRGGDAFMGWALTGLICLYSVKRTAPQDIFHRYFKVMTVISGYESGRHAWVIAMAEEPEPEP